jgi:hypothetical protein
VRMGGFGPKLWRLHNQSNLRTRKRANFCVMARYCAANCAARRYYLGIPRPASEEMKKPCLFLLLFAAATPAWGQGQPPLNVKPAVKGAVRADNCAPIGRTANGELVYSMKCDNMPAPVPPPQAKVEEPAPPPPPPRSDEGRSGLFGWSFDRRQSDQ